MKFSELVELYKRDYLTRKSSLTQVKQKQQLNYWLKHLGDKNVVDIKPVDIIKARSLLKVSDASKNVYMMALSHVFTIATRELELINSNPVSKVSSLKKPRGRVRFLSEEERKKLLSVCEESANPYLYLVVLLALSTGARKMELMKLKWSDIDFDRNVINIRLSKEDRSKTLVLVKSAKELLLKMERQSEYVFTGRKGDQFLDIRYPFEEAIKKAEIKDFRFHDLRHSCASYLAMSGASLNDIAEILGHSSIEMTKRYIHLSTHHKEQVINKMIDKINL